MVNNFKKFSIYKIENTVDHKNYVGCTTKTLDERLHEHILQGLNPNTRKVTRSPLYDAIAMHGADKFSISLLEPGQGSKEVMYSRESYWIRELGTRMPLGYNISGRLLSDEQVAIIRYSNCGLSSGKYAKLFNVSQPTIMVAKSGKGSCYQSDPYEYITPSYLPSNVAEYLAHLQREVKS